MRRGLACYVVMMFSLISASGLIHADIYQYSFTGELPTGSTNHAFVEDGELYAVLFAIDTKNLDLEPGDVTFGLYEFGVLSADIEFSGGYTASINVDDLFIAVGDNFNVGGGVFLDGIQITNQADFGVETINTVNLDSLTSDALPPPGTSFSSADQSGIGFFELVYVDQHGTIDYDTNDAQTSTFTAPLAIPEPSAALLLLLSMIVGLRSRNRR